MQLSSTLIDLIEVTVNGLNVGPEIPDTQPLLEAYPG